MLRAHKHVDKDGTWLDFAEIEGKSQSEDNGVKISSISAQIPRTPKHSTPLNVFWWGQTDVKQVFDFFAKVICGEMSQGPLGTVRAVGYGATWKSVKEIPGKEFTGGFGPGVATALPEETLSFRLDYFEPGKKSAAGDAIKISVWSRLDAPPDESDPDAIESIGIYMPFDELRRNEKSLVDFFARTSMRPIPSNRFRKIIATISEDVPAP